MILYGILIMLLGSVISEETCPKGTFKCNNGECIPAYLVCDYRQDCAGAEDELQSCPPPDCKPEEWSCGQYAWNETYCIPFNRVCDGTIDCQGPSYGADEEGCVYRNCSEGDFRCDDKICLPASKRCDGYVDCRSGLDEGGCPGISCTPDHFRCEDGKKCVHHRARCNYYADCLDGSDEKGCAFERCDNQTQFACANGRCVSKQFECDGYSQCSDESDEINCEQIFYLDQFLCPSDSTNDNFIWVSMNEVCDGKMDCVDGADELQCLSHLCPSLDCEYKCMPSLDGGYCTCPSGFVLASDNKTCADKNECEEWGYCDQICTNNNGGYNCSCAEGFFAEVNSFCLPVLDSVYQLLYVDYRGLLIGNFADRQEKLLINSTSINAIDYHYERNLIIWSDVKTRKVFVQTLNSTNENFNYFEITMPVGWLPIALSVDWIGNKLYIVDSLGQKIDIFELDGTLNTNILSLNLTDPTDIVLDPTVGYLFVADKKILRANMDGTNVTILISEKVYSITVDIISKRIFWAYLLFDYIETADYEGRHKQTVLRGHDLFSPSQLSFFGGKVYLLDCVKRSVFAISKLHGAVNPQPIFLSGHECGLQRFEIYSSLKQKYVANPCGIDNGGCEQMCLLTAERGSSYKCACKTGWSLEADLRSCTLTGERLIYAKQRIIKETIHNSSTFLAVSQKARFIAVDCDARENFVYYSDVLNDVVYRVNRSSGLKETIVKHVNVEGLAFDWMSRNLYYVEREGTLNVVSTRNVTHKRTLLNNLRRPRAVALHPSKGLVFFSEWSRPGRINRVDSAGADLLPFDVEVGWPNGLSVDHESDRLYWCDGLLSQVMHSDLEGNDAKAIYSDLIGHPFGIVAHAGFLYVSDWRSNAIVRFDKRTGLQGEVIVQETSRVYGVKILYEWPEDMEEGACAGNGDCEQLCFNFPEKKCGCSDGEELNEDGRSCSSVANVENQI